MTYREIFAACEKMGVERPQDIVFVDRFWLLALRWVRENMPDFLEGEFRDWLKDNQGMDRQDAINLFFEQMQKEYEEKWS